MKDKHWSETGRRGLIGRLLDRFADRLFAEDDERAVARGWEVRRGPGGGRVYRDPRWDAVRGCEYCGGTGMASRAWASCEPCEGTGVIRSTPAGSRTEVGR